MIGSWLKEAFRSWRFRSSYPTVTEGKVYEVWIGGHDPESGELIVRLGDTVLRINRDDPTLVDELVTVEVTEYNPDNHEARAQIVKSTASPNG